MFKVKAKKCGLETLKDNLIFKSGVLSGKMSEGIKQANSQIIHINEYMKKNPALAIMRDKFQKNPAGSALAITGIGLALFGVFSLFQKK